jgi:hypothetical protein
MGSKDYYGYTSGTNTQLTRLRQLARHTGDDVTHYTPADTSRYYADYTPTYTPSKHDDHPYYSSDDPKQAGIEKIYKRVMAQKAGKVLELVGQWKAIRQSLADMSDHIGTVTDKLAPQWQSSGGDLFRSMGPGATLKSLDDWTKAADVNIHGFTVLAGVITKHQGEMTKLWSEYTASQAQYKSDFLAGKNYPYVKISQADFDTLHQNTPDAPLFADYMFGLKNQENEYAYRAQVIESNMAKGYFDVATSGLNGSTATTYEGPTNAVLAPPGMPLLPGGFPSGPGGGPAAPVSSPPSPPSPPRPAVAGLLPQGRLAMSGLQGHVLPPNAPPPLPDTPPALPPAPPAPPALPNAPGPGAPPVAPGGPGVLPAGALPFAAGAPRAPAAPPGFAGAPSAPAAPSQQGSGTAPPSLGRGMSPKPGRGGVLGPKAPATPSAGMRQPSAPPLSKVARPGQRLPSAPKSKGEDGRSGQSARGLPPNAGRPGQRVPSSPQRTRQGNDGTNDPSPPIAPASFDEMPLPAASVTPPVLDGGQPRGPVPPPPGMGSVPGRPTPSGATTPVMNSRATSTRRSTPAAPPAAPVGGPAEREFSATPPPTSPVLGSPATAPRPPSPGQLEEVPAGLRGATSPAARQAARLAQADAAPPTGSKRRRRRGEGRKRPAAASPAADEAPWTVETPHDGVLASGTEQETPPAKPRRVLGGFE